jgi:hypothetical protein
LDFATGINSGNKEPVKWAALFDERVKKQELGIWNLEFGILHPASIELTAVFIMDLLFKILVLGLLLFSRNCIFFIIKFNGN